MLWNSLLSSIDIWAKCTQYVLVITFVRVRRFLHTCAMCDCSVFSRKMQHNAKNESSMEIDSMKSNQFDMSTSKYGILSENSSKFSSCLWWLWWWKSVSYSFAFNSTQFARLKFSQNMDDGNTFGIWFYIVMQCVYSFPSISFYFIRQFWLKSCCLFSILWKQIV